MNKYSILFLLVIFSTTISCTNNNKPKYNIASDTTTSDVDSKQEDTTTLKFTDNKLDSTIVNSDTPSFFNGSNAKLDDYIIKYPNNQKTEFRSYMEEVRKEWKNVPNPITATYKGNDFGDYHHVIFKDAKGVSYDFGQANNNYGAYKLHKLSGNYDDNPEFLGKKFNVYWDWKLSEFLCCDGEYGKAKAYLPSITKLELIKK